MDRIMFQEALEKEGLTARFCEEGNVEVGKNEFANPLLYFNLSNSQENYNGSVTVKAYNRKLFTPKQIVAALDITNDFLYNPLLKDTNLVK